VPIVDPAELAAMKAEIAETQKKLDQAQRDLKSQNKVITGLQGQITGLQAALGPFQGLQKRFWWVIGAIFVVFFFTMVAVVEGMR